MLTSCFDWYGRWVDMVLLLSSHCHCEGGNAEDLGPEHLEQSFVLRVR